MSMTTNQIPPSNPEIQRDSAIKAIKDTADPVCHMSVNPVNARNHEYNGTTYYFCSETCKGYFKANPEKYSDLFAKP